ncbi:MAG: hypothetical protein IKV59_07255 [Lachnospiraceae bacterium]|nr:hypothetical protein [Lachnospiraceae bacterium]
MYSWKQYHIMHGRDKVAEIQKNGLCRIYIQKKMPYNLYLEEGDDLDTRVQNLDNFYYWCASRLLTLDRIYAKEILNSIGAGQANTDRQRAMTALSYHCLSLRDIYWTEEGERQDFSQINLYENHLSDAFVDVSLRGKQMTIQNSHLIADDLATHGCYPKAWIRREGTFYLLKDGGKELVQAELLASKICQCFRCRQVIYEEGEYDGQPVSVSRIITSLEKSIVPMEYFMIYAANEEIDWMQYVLELDAYSYHMMNILDYLIGNTDRHWGNWGLLVDNQTNVPVRLYDLMDFNKAFQAYDTTDGANCLTTQRKMTQREAAVEGVKAVGLNQLREIPEVWFEAPDLWGMFCKRMEILKSHQL